MSILRRLREEQKADRKSSPTPEKEAPKAEKPKRERKPQGSYKRGRGRSPSASPAYVRSKRVTIALSLPEFEALHAAAAGHGIAASTFVRKALFGEVKAVRPHPERPKSEAQAALLANEPQKLDGRTRAGKAAKRRKTQAKK
jgi:hypothetical protein